GALDGVVAEIGAENLYGDFQPQFGKHFHQRDGMGISFLAGGASRHPYTDSIGDRAVPEKFWIYIFAQALKDFRIAKETGDIDEHIAVEGLDLLRITVEQFHVVVQLAHLIDVHAADDPAPDGGALVFDEVNFAVAFQQPENIAQKTFFSGKRIVCRFHAG